MDNGLDAVDDEQMIDLIDVAEIAHHQSIGWDGLAVPRREVIEYRHIVSAIEELLDGMAADATRAASHQDACHQFLGEARKYTSFILFLGLFTPNYTTHGEL